MSEAGEISCECGEIFGVSVGGGTVVRVGEILGVSDGGANRGEVCGNNGCVKGRFEFGVI